MALLVASSFLRSLSCSPSPPQHHKQETETGDRGPCSSIEIHSGGKPIFFLTKARQSFFILKQIADQGQQRISCTPYSTQIHLIFPKFLRKAQRRFRLSGEVNQKSQHRSED